MVGTQYFLCWGPRVQSLVEELGSHKARGASKKKKKNRRRRNEIRDINTKEIYNIMYYTIPYNTVVKSTGS